MAALIENDPAAAVELIMSLLARVEELERRIGRSSRNSSLPPSRDSPEQRKQRPKKKGSGRKQGGQPGHPGTTREMVSDPDEVVEHWPQACDRCGGGLGRDGLVGNPVAHQVNELLVSVHVTEHRRMRVRCGCGRCVLAGLPVGVPAGAFGPGVAAAATTLTAARVSRREVARLLEDLLGITLSPASVDALVQQASAALEDPYIELLEHLDDSAVRHVDETSWRHPREGAWLSVAAAADAAIFQIADRRDRAAAHALIGENPGGIIVTDRYGVYEYLSLDQRQLCLCHILLSFIELGERGGAPGKLGRALADALARIFKKNNDPDRDRLDLPKLRADTASDRELIHELLLKGSRGRDQKTRRFCSGLLKHEQAFWTYTLVPGVAATNNTAERSLRSAVLWRKTSGGTQTFDGDRLVERLLTMRETCRLRGQRLHNYLVSAITAHQHAQPVPSPLQI
ncbi:MAG: IS66 family transposase [Solirubrobacteraceae bacterium]